MYHKTMNANATYYGAWDSSIEDAFFAYPDWTMMKNLKILSSKVWHSVGGAQDVKCIKEGLEYLLRC